jgi:hypothetical protein
VGLARAVRQTLSERTPAGTGRPAWSTGSTMTRSSQRWMPGPRKQPTPTGPASEVPYMLATGAQNASAKAWRTSGSRGSLVVVIRLGWIRSRPARASAASRASMDG